MTLSADRLSRPDWSCVHFTTEGPDEEQLEERDLALVLVHGERLADDGELLDALAVGFSFPDYFGGNWDAADECLRDLSWLPAEGYVLVVSGAGDLWARQPRTAGRLVESWLFCAEAWARREKPFHLVFEW